MKPTAVMLWSLLLLGGFTCRDSGPHPPPPAPRETNIDEPSAQRVPDVEHQDLRSAYDELQQAGFEVRFSAELERFNYPEYVRDRSRIVHPEPWVADVDPEPGEPAPHGVVTITATECPERAASCD